MAPLKILAEKDILPLIGMAQIMEVVRDIYMDLSQNKIRVPQRLHLPVEESGGVTLFMPAYAADRQSLGAKIVSVFPHNRGSGTPTIHAVILLLDAATGRPAALLDGTQLTALRTGAASGVASSLLARPNAETAAIIGAGVEGRTQLLAISHARRLKSVWIYDPDSAAVKKFIREMQASGPPVPQDLRTARSSAEAVREADIICTATTSNQPVFSDNDLKTGVHINAVGSYRPDMQEIPEETVARAGIYVDSRAACLKETGDLIIPLRKNLIKETNIRGEIGEVALGRQPGRLQSEEITLFKSVGTAALDLGVAEQIMKRARELQVGLDCEF